jgi:hypothetical protein
MAYQTKLTYGSKVGLVEQLYYSPVAQIPQQPGISLSSIYCLLAKNDPWDDENNPPAPTQDQAYLKQFAKRVFVAKFIPSNNISPVIRRINWTSGTIYSYYNDKIDMFAVDSNGYLLNNFYIINQYDQVFKCLWNNNGSASTVQPFFQPGTFDTNNIFHGSDGYKWKYMFTVDLGLKVTFMDANWIPVPVGLNTPNPLYDVRTNAAPAAGVGSIDVINVTNGGSGYDAANAVIMVTITGDGYGATGTASVANGSITDINVTSAGSNYTYANVAITSLIGSGATAISPTSPIGGHGFDPVSELGVSGAMLVCEFKGSESGAVPTDIMYHQIGIVVNPTTYSLDGVPANGSIYKTTTDLVVAPGFGTYITDELIYQGASVDNPSFIATVLSFDSTNNVVKLINTTGTPANNASLFGNTTKTTRTVLSSSTPDFVSLSGYISYLENRTGIQRSVDGIEQFKIVLGY